MGDPCRAFSPPFETTPLSMNGLTWRELARVRRAVSSACNFMQIHRVFFQLYEPSFCFLLVSSSSRLAVTSWNSTRAFLPLSLLRVEDVPPLRELIATVLKRSRPRVPRRLVRLTTVSDVRIRRAMRAERSPSVRGRLSSSGAQFPRLRRGPSRFWLMTMRRQ